ncbi:MAG: hypothetical protein ACT4OM_12020 [Actinomycetota bacterium]
MPNSLWTLATLPVAVFAAPVLGTGFTLLNLATVARHRPAAVLVAVLNLPFDLLTNTLGFFFGLGFYPIYAAGPEHPAVGRREGSLVFIGGPVGWAISRMASGFTPTSTVFITRRAWGRLSREKRDRLINHELWHARRQFLRYSGWLFWPAYLASNLIWGTHRKNPFESGRRGAYRNVDDRWELGYRQSADYLDCCQPFWREGPGR